MPIAPAGLKRRSVGDAKVKLTYTNLFAWFAATLRLSSAYDPMRLGRCRSSSEITGAVLLIPHNQRAGELIVTGFGSSKRVHSSQSSPEP